MLLHTLSIKASGGDAG